MVFLLERQYIRGFCICQVYNCHSKHFVRAVILHTNFAECYHSLLKRGIIGAFHHISEKHMERYLREFEFRWNTRKMSDGERTALAIKGIEGKRLVYKSPQAGQ